MNWTVVLVLIVGLAAIFAWAAAAIWVGCKTVDKGDNLAVSLAVALSIIFIPIILIIGLVV